MFAHVRSGRDASLRSESDSSPVACTRAVLIKCSPHPAHAARRPPQAGEV